MSDSNYESERNHPPRTMDQVIMSRLDEVKDALAIVNSDVKHLMSDGFNEKLKAAEKLGAVEMTVKSLEINLDNLQRAFNGNVNWVRGIAASLVVGVLLWAFNAINALQHAPRP